jgi:chromate transporter
VAGPVGAVVAALATFVPCYLFTVIPAPYFRRFAKNKSIKAFVDGVSAAAAGAIAGATIVLGRRAIYDIPTIAIFVVALALLIRFKKLQEPLLIVSAGVLGVVLSKVLHQ